jgi:hypothetical protein
MTESATAPDDNLFFVERDAELLLTLRGRVWGSDHPHTDPRFFAWVCAQSPRHLASGVMVRHRGRAVGFAGMCVKRQVVGGRDVKFAHGLDYMIEPGLSDVLAGRVALRVPLRWHRLAESLGCTSSVVFPNHRSMHILTSNRVGMTPIFQPGLLVRPLSTARFKERIHNVPRRALATATRLVSVSSWVKATAYGRPQGEAEPVERFDDGFDELWHGTRDQLGVATVRDAAYLKWRFEDHPVYRYRILGWRRGGAWIGYVVCLERRLFGVDTMMVVDILSPQLLTVGPALLDAAMDEARGRGLGMMVALALRGGSLHAVLKGRGFYDVPARLDPKRFTAVEHVYDESIRADLAASPRYFTWSDMDVV